MELFLLTSMQYSLLRIDEYVCVQKSTAKYMGSVSDGRSQVERDRGDRSGGGWGGDSRATLGLLTHVPIFRSLVFLHRCFRHVVSQEERLVSLDQLKHPG